MLLTSVHRQLIALMTGHQEQTIGRLGIEVDHGLETLYDSARLDTRTHRDREYTQPRMGCQHPMALTAAPAVASARTPCFRAFAARPVIGSPAGSRLYSDPRPSPGPNTQENDPMARREAAKQKLSYEIIGMAAILAVFAVGLLIYLLTSPNAIKEPDFNTVLGPDGKEIPTSVDQDGRPVLGRPDATVTVYEFADFQCPHCQHYTLTQSKAVEDAFVATGMAKMVWVNAPFGGAESEAAAKAALCAGQQGKFWVMHDWLYFNQPKVRNSNGFSAQRLEDIAERIGLDKASYNACLTDPAIQDQVEADNKLLAAKGVNSTPTFLIGERKVEGADGEQLKKVIQETFDAAK